MQWCLCLNFAVIVNERSPEWQLHNYSDYLMARSCETAIALLGTSNIVSMIGHYVGSIFHWILCESDEDRSSGGSLSGVLFFILALQAGLTGLPVEKRLLRLRRNLWLLCTAMLHFIHSTLHHVLIKLSTSGNFRIGQHARAHAISLFLFLAPCIFLYCIWSDQTTIYNPWILSITIFAVEVIVKLIVSLTIYCLLLIGTRNVGGNWERMDDYVYEVKATGAILEFVFGVLLFFNGIWIMFYERGGIIRAVMICIHAYCKTVEIQK